MLLQLALSEPAAPIRYIGCLSEDYQGDKGQKEAVDTEVTVGLDCCGHCGYGWRTYMFWKVIDEVVVSAHVNE